MHRLQGKSGGSWRVRPEAAKTPPGKQLGVVLLEHGRGCQPDAPPPGRFPPLDHPHIAAVPCHDLCTRPMAGLQSPASTAQFLGCQSICFNMTFEEHVAMLFPNHRSVSGYHKAPPSHPLQSASFYSQAHDHINNV